MRIGSALLAVAGVVAGTGCWPKYLCCESNEVCSDGYLCVGGVCRPRCSYDGQCAKGERCDPISRTCTGGPLPAACAPDLWADGGSADAAPRRDGGRRPDAPGRDRIGRDVRPTDAGLGDLQRVDAGSGPDASLDGGEPDKPDTDGPQSDGAADSGGCQDDLFEDNDYRAQATPLTSEPIDAVLCPGDHDWYSIGRESNETVHAHIECANASSIVLMLLRLPTGAHLLRSCDPALGTADAQLAVPQPGAAYIEVWSENLDQPSRYRLQAWVDGGTTSCGSDAFEPNDGISQASPVHVDTTLHAVVCATDTDCFSFAVDAHQLITVTQVLQQACSGDVLTLLAPDGTTVLDQDTSGAAQRAVESYAPRTGQYYACVGSGCATSSYYSLYLGAGQCVDDAYEENDSMRDPATVPEGVVAGQICWRDDDFFAFAVGAPETRPIHLDLRFMHAVGDLDLALLDPSLRQVAISQGVTDSEVIDHRPALPGTYQARVYGFGGAVGPYSLQICRDDVYEQNDSVATAVDLAAGAIQAVLCRHDYDHYAVSLVAGGTLSAALRATSMPDDVELVLLRASDSGEVARGVTTGDGRLLVFNPSAAGRYLLCVRAPAGGSMAYDLTIDF
ncbi:MAG: hypothetical protein JXR83_05920 [Deltaproteobacteria bacterium]|nr:hypothetical protein [Deltaproteobacteria bacterium]